MKIAVNCIYYTPTAGGIKEYINNLVRNLEKFKKTEEIIYYITEEFYDEFSKLVRDSGRIKIFPYSENQKYRRSFFQMRFWRSEEKKERFDLFHSTFFHAPKFKFAKTILTVHDLRFLNYPSSYKFTRLYYLKYRVKKSIIEAEHLIAISNFTKQEIIKHYKIPHNLITVIHEAVDKNGFELQDKMAEIQINKHRISKDKFFLAVGHLEPRKNYQRLIQAYTCLPIKIQEQYKLIIVGKKGHKYNETLSLINTNTNIIYLNFIKRQELAWLYSNCKIHVFPSIYEGFGFPTLEAGIFGKPTVGADQSSIPEIAGKGGIYFNPFSVEDISEKMLELIRNYDKYQALSKEALLNTKKFSWEKNAKDTLSVYKKINSNENHNTP